jgi:hypothetical protein
MDVELTSARDDDTFTWRAAGARQPKGAVAASMLPKGSKVGDVLRIEAEVEIDGITVVSVLPPKEKEAPSGRIEVLGTQRPVAGVTTVLAGPADRRRENRFFRDGEERRPSRPGGDRRPRRDGEGPADSRARPAATGERAPATGEQAAATDGERRPPARRDRPEGERGGRPRSRFGSEVASARRDLGAPPRDGSAAPAGRGPRTPAGPSARPGTGSRPGAPPRRDSAPRGEHPGRGPDRTTRPRRGPVRLEAGTRHRDELMATLPAEQQLIADRLATGGMPGMRKAIADEQERAKAEGRPPVAADSILALAEQLQPAVKSAVWMDRAEAALAHLDELGLRDLRATVVAAAPRDDAGRDLERQLREGLERRVAKLRTDWDGHLTQALDEGKVLQALRLSARPPEPTARFPAGLIERLVSQVGAAMSAETPPERWLALLEAAALCPVRRQIKPAGIPEDASGEVQRKAREAAGRIPALAPMLGMAMPPPPKPIPGERLGRPHPVRPPRPTRPPRPPRPPRPAGAGPAGRRPNAPSAPDAQGLSAGPEPAVASSPAEAPVAEPAEAAAERAVETPSADVTAGPVVAPEPAEEAVEPAEAPPADVTAGPVVAPEPAEAAVEPVVEAQPVDVTVAPEPAEPAVEPAVEAPPAELAVAEAVSVLPAPQEVSESVQSDAPVEGPVNGGEDEAAPPAVAGVEAAEQI